jgi:hypothetical protein
LFVVGAAGLAVLFGLSSAAYAGPTGTTKYTVEYSLGDGLCTGKLQIEYTTTWYAAAYIENSSSNSLADECNGVLQRSVNYGAWQNVSSVHHEGPHSSVQTYWYLDSAGYRARVCIEGVEGGNHVCTPAW